MQDESRENNRALAFTLGCELRHMIVATNLGRRELIGSYDFITVALSGG